MTAQKRALLEIIGISLLRELAQHADVTVRSRSPTCTDVLRSRLRVSRKDPRSAVDPNGAR